VIKAMVIVPIPVAWQESRVDAPPFQDVTSLYLKEFETYKLKRFGPEDL